MTGAAEGRLAKVKAGLSELQLSVLGHVWQEFQSKSQWPSTRAIHQRFGKHAVLAALHGLGGSVVFEKSDQPGKRQYHLTLLGVLLTSERQRAEALLIRFLGYLRKRFNEDPDVEKVTGSEVQAALNLEPEDTKVLGSLIELGHLWGNTSIGLAKDENWSAGVPEEIDDLPPGPGIPSYVLSRALEGFDPDLPVSEAERMRYIVNREHSRRAALGIGSRKGVENAARRVGAGAEPRWDAFICHAGEDKDEVVEPLAIALRARGLDVWYDRWVLEIGDSLRRRIDEGLKESRFGIVVLSQAFFGKEWPQKELDGLVQKEVDGRKVVLPVWHRVTHADVAAFSLPLADRIAGETHVGVPSLAEQLAEVMEKPPEGPAGEGERSSPSGPREIDGSAVEKTLDPGSAAAEAIRALRLGRPDVGARVREFVESLAKSLDALKPSLVKGDEDELLIQALNQSTKGVCEFGTVAKTVAEMASEEGAVSLFRGLKWILEGYWLPRGASGQFLRTQFDYHKFLGHELCVLLYQCLLLDRRWETISRLLGEGIQVENTRTGRADIVGLEYVSQHSELLDVRGHRMSLHPGWVRARLIADRHGSGLLGKIAPIAEFLETDFFLLLASRGQPSAFGGGVRWRPWSIFVANEIPRFLLEAYRVRQASILAKVVEAGDIEALKVRIRERATEVGRFVGGFGTHMFDGLDLARIGTE